MDYIRCCLRDIWRYCQEHPGMCCRICPEWASCDKGCLNSPERCGQASNIDTRPGRGVGARFRLKRDGDGGHGV